MRVLNDYVCRVCGARDERYADSVVTELPCLVPGCDGVCDKRPPRTQHVENFGATGVHHAPGRRLSKAEQERRDHYRQTRHKEQNPQAMTPRPKVFG